MGHRVSKPVKKQNKKVAKKPSPKRPKVAVKQRKNKKGGTDSTNSTIIAQPIQNASMQQVAQTWHPGMQQSQSHPIHQPVQPMSAITNNSSVMQPNIIEQQLITSQQDVAKIDSELQ